MTDTTEGGMLDLYSFLGDFVKKGALETARREGLYGRSVHIFLFDTDGRLLVVRRPKTKRYYPSKLTSSAGGHVEEGESFMEAACRELREELGISPPLTHVGRFDVVSSRERTIHHLFSATLSAQRLDTDPDEIAEFTRMPLSEAVHDSQQHPWRYANPFKCALKAYDYYLGKRMWVLDFDHTLFNWYGFKKDLVHELQYRLGVPESTVHKAQVMCERSSLYSFESHLQTIAQVSKVDLSAIFGIRDQMEGRLPEYIYPDARIFLEKLKRSKQRTLLLTYGEPTNQEFFVRKTQIHDLVDTCEFVKKKSEKKKKMRDLVRKGFSINIVNDDPTETELMLTGRWPYAFVYLVERPNAKYTRIPHCSEWEVINSFDEIVL
ncbi:NUDIX domain-containing protein [Patescibacteria group bacterium]|jgi:8-oxo-dGTP pyrophosphatase MutT (NUDIX family)|nr:NUDIX domain-containing protein [Patescibacteria group bacterium]